MPKRVNGNVKIAVIANDVKHIRGEVTEIKKKLDEDYVTKTEFDPIKRLVYGVVSVILIAVASAIMGVILIRATL